MFFPHNRGMLRRSDFSLKICTSSTVVRGAVLYFEVYNNIYFKENLNASKPYYEHPPDRGKKCQNVWVGIEAAKTKPLHGI